MNFEEHETVQTGTNIPAYFQRGLRNLLSFKYFSQQAGFGKSLDNSSVEHIQSRDAFRPIACA